MAAAAPATAVFRFLPVGVTGVTDYTGAGAAAPDVCTTFQSTITTGASNHFCLRGSGTQYSSTGWELTNDTSGSLDFGDATLRFVPSGADGADIVTQYCSGTTCAGWATGAVTRPEGDVSGCAFLKPQYYNANRSILSNDDVTTHGLHFYYSSTGGLNLTITKAGGGATTANSGTVITPPMAWNLACFTYDYVADGSSVIRLYLNGEAVGTPSTTAVGPIAAMSDTWVAGGRNIVAGISLDGWMGAAFVSEGVVYSAASLAALWASIAPTYTGSAGQTVTVARASTRTCARSNVIYTVNAARPCVTDNKFWVGGEVTNSLQKSEYFAATPWVLNETPTLTKGAADCTPAPDGSTNAFKVAIVTSATDTYLYQLLTGAAAVWTYSGWMREPTGGSGTPEIHFAMDTGAVEQPTASHVLPGTSWGRAFPSYDFTTGGAPGRVLVGGWSSWTDPPDGNLCLWGVQSRVADWPGRYVYTYGTAASSLADSVTIASTTGWPTSSGSVSMKFTPEWSVAQDAVLLNALAGSPGNGWQVSVTTAGKIKLYGENAGTASYAESDVLTWTAGTEYVVTVSWNGTSVSFFRDGSAVGTATLSAAAFSAVATSAHLGSQAATRGANGGFRNVCVGAVGACP